MRSTKKFQALPFNPKLSSRARELRKAGLLHEALMWRVLKKGKLNGLDFDRQKVIGNYIVDFYCAERNVVIEIDGRSHDDRLEYDEKRDAYLYELGLTVIRISVRSVLQQMEEVVTFLKEHPCLSLTPPETEN